MKGMMNHFKLAIVVCLAFVSVAAGSVAMEGMTSWVMMGLVAVPMGMVLAAARFGKPATGISLMRSSLVRRISCIALIVFVGSVALPVSGWAASINVYRFLDDGDNSYNGEEFYTDPGIVFLKRSGSTEPNYFRLEEGERLEYPVQTGEYTIWQYINPAFLAASKFSLDQIPWSSEDTGLTLTVEASGDIQAYDDNGDFSTSGQNSVDIYFPLPAKASEENDVINQKKQELEDKCATPDIVLCGYDPDQGSYPDECYAYSEAIVIELPDWDMDKDDLLTYWNDDSISVDEDFISIKEAIKGKVVVSYGMVMVPYYNSTAPLSMLGMCNYGTLKSPRGAESLAIEFEDVIMESGVPEEKNFFANFGKVEGSTPIYPSDDYSLKGGNITLTGITSMPMPGLPPITSRQTGNFYNEGWIQGGNSVKFTYEESFDGYSPDEYFDQLESTGGDVEIAFGNLYTKNAILGGDGFSMHYQNSGDAMYAHIWDESTEDNYGAGKGGKVTLIGTGFFASVTSFIKGGDGGDVSADYACEGCTIEVKGGIGGTVNVQGDELQGAGGFKGGSVYIEPDIMISGKDTRIEAEKDVVIFGGDNWQLKLNDLNDNAIVAGRNIILAVGNGGVIDLRGNNGKVFKAGGKVEIYADNVLLDQGVQLEDIIQASEIVEGPNKIIYRVILSAQDVRGQANETVSVELNVSNAGPEEDSYNLSVVSEKGTTVDGLPSTVQVQGLGHKRLLLNLTLPVTASVSDKVTVKATSHKDPNVVATKRISVFTEAAPDSDGDGITDDKDAFPNDPAEWSDSDGDGTGDNADTDDDNDEMPDIYETGHGLDSVINDASEDLDGDGYTNFEEYEADTDPNDPDSHPDDPYCSYPGACYEFNAGVFTVNETGKVKSDWLYDGGAYQGELGIFSLFGMEDFTPGSPEFIREAVRRAMSDTEEGCILLSDRTQGARFSGPLGGGSERERNSGPYKGLRTCTMAPGDTFSTILVPNATLENLYRNPETANPHLRPIFSLASSNPEHDMYFGQIAEVEDAGKAFVYEDMLLSSGSDRDYNDLIVRITGITVSVPTLDNPELGFENDWRITDNPLIPHIRVSPPDPETLWVVITLKSPADLLVYDPQDRVIGKDGGYIPGATFEYDENGHQVVTVPELASGDYRIVLRAIGDGGLCHLEIKGYQGDNELSALEEPFEIGPHQTFSTVLSADSFTNTRTVAFETPALPETPEGNALTYDFDGNGRIDDADISRISSVWNSCQDDPGFDQFFDLDNDGCITVLDLMTVVNSR